MRKQIESRDEFRNRQRARYRRRVEGVKIYRAEQEKGIFDEGTDWLVAIYTRVSTGNPKQVSSIEMQRAYYLDFVERQPNMRLIDIYPEEGISGTSLKNRVQFNQMIKDCVDGKKGINLIVVKSISRFARSVEDFANVTRQLRELNPPIGVYFELEGLCTLNPDQKLNIDMLSTFAEYESAQKSAGTKRANKIKFANGNFTPQKFQGYDIDDDGGLIINEDEARTIKLIFYLYLSGYSTARIAEILMEFGRKTTGHSKKNPDNLKWSSSTVEYILQNEKYYGAYDAGKTWTKSYKDHISRPNTINPVTGKHFSDRYFLEDSHDAIISYDDYVAAQRLLSNAKYGRTILPEMKVIESGALRGFVSLNHRWAGFTVEDYMEASESVYSFKERDADEKPDEVNVKARDIDFRGYEVLRPQFLSRYKQPCFSMSDEKLWFTTECLRNLDNTQYAEILIEPFKGLIAIRPCERDNRNAIKWARLRKGKYVPAATSGLSFNAMLFDMFGWFSDYKRRLMGTNIQKGKDSFLIFDVNEAEIIRPVSLEDSREIIAYSDEWDGSFGEEYYSWQQSVPVQMANKVRLNASAEAKVYRNEDSLNVTEQAILKKSIEHLMQELKMA
ncbi:MAG: recombinase family protein [Rickettsiales bacterium]|jgi:DNA invertase Pin-like site-specific DNA recombinase|nr:recombinase family protein [Rickettsiales bacterium]